MGYRWQTCFGAQLFAAPIFLGERVAVNRLGEYIFEISWYSTQWVTITLSLAQFS